MIEPAELTQRILAELEDTGFDNIHSILNTVINPVGSLEEVDRFRQSLTAITQGELGYLSLEGINPRDLVKLSGEQTVELLTKLADWFRFDQTDQYWMLGNGDPLKDRFPVLFLTRRGVEKAREILEARGYHWWIVRKR